MDGTTAGTTTPSQVELPAKYHKLATEYAKIRSQVSVLKRAVLEEQVKNATLKDDILARDQAFRKSEQELDSLTFRNTQLEKRVGFLQDELAAATAKGRTKQKGKSAEAAPDSAQPVFDYELLTKIDENIQLHKQISEMEEAHRRQMIELRLEYENQIHASNDLKKLQDRLEIVEQDRQSLTSSLQNSLDEISAYQEQVSQLQDKIRSLSQSNQFSRGNSQSFDDALSPDHVNELPSPECEVAGTINLVDKLTKAETDKEHWMLEYQLLHMKYRKLFVKLEEAKELLKNHGTDWISGDITPCNDTNLTITSMIGKMEVIGDEPDVMGRSYEKEVKEYLTARINELVGQLQMAESKALTFYGECEALSKLLLIASGHRSTAEERVQELNANLSNLREELQVTKNSYEAQLLTMTEHVANMNDKLTLKQDTIEQLNYQLANKGKKK